MKKEHPIVRIQLQQNEIGRLLQANRTETAVELARQSVKEAEKAFGPSDPNTAATLSTLGACLSQLDEQEEACKVLESALNMNRVAYGEQHLSTVQVLNNLSPVYRKLHRFRAALESALTALEVRLEKLGREDPATATSLVNVGLALSGIGQLQAALDAYQLAAPYDTDTGKASGNFQTLVAAIRADGRFRQPENISQEENTPSVGLSVLMEACKQLLAGEPDGDKFLLRQGLPSHTESYINFAFKLKTALHETADLRAEEAPRRFALLRRAQRRLLTQTSAPAIRVRLLLKRVDRSHLGDMSKATLEHVFPMFTGGFGYNDRLRQAGLNPDQYRSFNEIKKGNLGKRDLPFEITYVEQQFRRYAGDNNLPSNCYSAVCHEENGNDGQTLCRELFEYKDLRIPGFVFVGDSWDGRLMGALRSLGQGYEQPAQGIYVFMLPPLEPEKRPAYYEMYRPVLEKTGNWDGLSIIFIPTVQLAVEVDNVIDLRRRDTQEWFSGFFRKGDGAVFIKDTEEPPQGFSQMLPALVYPEYGGSGVTKSIGTWLRLAGVNGLVYPSARSNARVKFDERGEPIDFHGWNFVDYRQAALVPDPRVHFDVDPWYDFVAGRQEAPTLEWGDNGWAIRGSEKLYQYDRGGFIELMEGLSH